MDSPTKIQKDVSKNFIPVEDLKNMAVGHIGLYPVEPEEDETTSSADVLDPIINIGTGKGEKILLDVEPGVKLFIKDALCKKLDQELEKYGLSKDMERVKAIPNSMTGAVIYYLTKGIERDFGITWVNSPVSIREKETKLEKDKAKGRIGLSKKEKNELLAKLTYQYYEEDVNSGSITQQDAFAAMAEAAAKKKEYEDAGYFLSPNKTQGVSLYDWKSEVKEKLNGDDSVLKIYSRHSILPVVPCLEDKLTGGVNKGPVNPKAVKEIDKSIIAGIDCTTNGKMDMKNKIEGWENIKDNYEPRTFHIAKINKSGKMRDRWFVCDAIRKADGKQVLLMWDKNGVDGLLE